MPGYRPIVPLTYDYGGSGLGLAGEGLDFKKLSRAASKAADISLGLGGLAGYDVSKALAVKRVLDGGEMAGEGFGRGTQKKIKTAVKKGGRIGIGLVGEFGNDKQKRQVRKAERVVNGVDRAFSGGEAPGAKLRAMIQRLPKA
jgi:hypothetical protein